MSDIVEKLREYPGVDMREAADEIESLRAQLNAEREIVLPPFGHSFTVPVDRLDAGFLAWLRQHCVIVTEAEYTSLRARLAEATAFGVECQRGMEEARARLAEADALLREESHEHYRFTQMTEYPSVTRMLLWHMDRKRRIDAHLSRKEKQNES